MKSLTGLVLGVAVAALVGCGDNDKDCGEGTHLEDGLCVADEVTAPPQCGEGTMLDDLSNTCVIDEDSCQGGTILIAGQCVDPTQELIVDVVEGSEPNALGFLGEASSVPAGVATIKPIGATTVIKGNINGHPDTDEDGEREVDSDAYLFQANAPMLLEISVDGVAGLNGAFGLLPDPADADLQAWFRAGANLNGDTSRRQVFIPKAGIYELVISDSRSLFGDEDGIGDANTNYFASITQLAMPTAASVGLTNGTGTGTGTITSGEVKFFSAAPLGAGFTTVEAQTYDRDFRASVVVVHGSTLKGVGTEEHDEFGDAPATVFAAGFPSGQATLFAVEEVINTGNTDVDFFMRVTTAAGVQIPEETAGTVTLDNNTRTGARQDRAFFFFDATVANEIIALDVSFNLPVSGSILDAHGTTVANLTANETGRTFTAYKGLVRVRAPGRYYLGVFAPGSLVGADIVLTGRVGRPVMQTLTFGAPSLANPAGGLNSTAFSYASGTETWQQFSATANGASNGATIRVTSSATTYGALDDLVTNTTPISPTFPVLFTLTPGANATATQGAIASDLPATLLVLASTTSGAGQYDLSASARTYTDEGDRAAPFSNTRTTESFTAGAPNRYLIRTAPGNIVTITVDPALTQDAGIHELDKLENVIDTQNTAVINVTETYTTQVSNRGYVAYDVFPGAGTGGYSVTVEIQAPPAPPATDYTSSAGSTAWANICNLPSSIDLTPVDRDDDYTAPFALASGVQLYGTSVTQAKASTNGFMTFDVAAITNTVTGDTIPTADLPDMTIAPYWTDITNARICVLTVGSETTIQWTGNEYGDDLRYAMQVVLDGTSAHTVEIIYAPYHTNGALGAAGIQESSTNGQVEVEYSADELGGTSILLTPN